MADRAGWGDVVESELRAAGRELDVPPASNLTAAVQRRLEGPAVRRRIPAVGGGFLRYRLGWRAALVVVVAFLTLLIATPQGRAVISHVVRLAGVELRQGPGPASPPEGSAPLPGERRMPLEAARHQVSFPILVPAALGRPGEVVVSDRGRVVSLIYPRTRYGLVRIDEYAGHLDQIYFEKFLSLRMMT